VNRMTHDLADVWTDEARAQWVHEACERHWAKLPPDVEVTQHGWEAHLEESA